MSSAADEPGEQAGGVGAGVLFVVATPIGNLSDLTERGRAAFSEAALVVAEDTRRTRNLLSHLGLADKALRRLDAHAEPRAIDAVIDELVAGVSVALATDAGTPSVSDPGSALVQAARARGVRIVPIPGPSAVTTALSASGYAFGAFRFVGFLPRTGTDRARAIAALVSATEAVVLFEAPSRLAATLGDLAGAMPERRGFIARELTKKHEELLEDLLPALATHFASGEVLGEVTLVLAPWPGRSEAISDDDVRRAIEQHLKAGMRPREVAERVAVETGRSKREVYDLVLAMKNG